MRIIAIVGVVIVCVLTLSQGLVTSEDCVNAAKAPNASVEFAADAVTTCANLR